MFVVTTVHVRTFTPISVVIYDYRYGFKETPKLELVAKPRLGQRAVTLSQITHLIERKLCSLVDVSKFILVL